MARIQYAVVIKDGQWWVNLDGKHHGPYDTQAKAARAAIDAAHETGKKGHDAQVLVQGRDAKWRTEWTYGHDPYPPRG